MNNIDDWNIDKEMQISKEFDYSNIVADIESIAYLVQYCESLYNQLIGLIKTDEEKNEKLKYEYRNYEYKNSFSTNFEIIIRGNDTSFSTINCKNYQSFLDTINNGHLRNVSSLVIELNLTYKKGKEGFLEEYENIFNCILNFKFF